MNWIDSTTHSKFDKERKPRIISLNLTKRYTLVVHRHITDESTWFMTIHNTRIDMVDLYTDDLHEAKSKAIAHAIEFLYEQKEELEAAIHQLEDL